MANLVLHNLKKFPESYTYRYGELVDLDEYSLEYLPREVDEVWYWYAQGDYEGSGQMLMRNGDTYAMHNMGHCSCYGPCDNIEPKWETMEALLDRFSPNPDALREVSELISAAKP